jgi:hypothetical protein
VALCCWVALYCRVPLYRTSHLHRTWRRGPALSTPRVATHGGVMQGASRWCHVRGAPCTCPSPHSFLHSARQPQTVGTRARLLSLGSAHHMPVGPT